MAKCDFTTGRLIVADWRPDLANPERRRALEQSLAGILTDRVLAPLPPPLHFSSGKRDISNWVTARAEESDVLSITQTETGALIGLLLLAEDVDPSDQKTLHIGYLLAETVWGKGYATELVSGLVAHLSRGNPVMLIGGVDPSNPASARVLEKAGFVKDSELSSPDAEMFVRTLA